MEIGFELLQQSHYPCLLHGIDGQEEKIFHSIFEGTPFSAEFPYLRNKSLISSRNGWWIVKDLEEEGCIFILNPRSMERIELPKLDPLYRTYTCILTDSPKSIHCRFMLFDRSSRDVLFCKIGDSNFTKQELGFLPGSVAMFGGKIYVTHLSSSRLVSLWFEGQRVKIVNVIETEMVDLFGPPNCCAFKTYLIDSNDELLFLMKIYSPSINDMPPYNMEVADFMIYKLDSSGSSWKELGTIGGHKTLFLHGKEGILYNVDKDRSKIIQGNCIYYVDSHSHHLHRFNLKSGGISYVPYSTPVSDVNFDNHQFQWISLPFLGN